MEGNNSDTSEFVVFSKIHKNSVKTEKKICQNEVEPREELKKFWNPKFGRFDRIIGRFFKKLIIFEKPFWPIKKIWVNLNFNKLNDVIFEKYLHQFAHNSFYFFLHIFIFFKYFESVNSKIIDF
jgi:hypothetical protein